MSDRGESVLGFQEVGLLVLSSPRLLNRLQPLVIALLNLVIFSSFHCPLSCFHPGDGLFCSQCTAHLFNVHENLSIVGGNRLSFALPAPLTWMLSAVGHCHRIPISAGSLLDLGDGKFTARLRRERPFLLEQNIKDGTRGCLWSSMDDWELTNRSLSWRLGQP